MRALWRQLAPYRFLVGATTQVAYAYRANLLFNLIAILLQIYALKMVWTAAYGDSGIVEGVDLDSLIAYLTMVNLQIWIAFPFLAYHVAGRVRRGEVALDLARPVSFLGQMLAQQVGTTIAVLPLVLLSLPLGMIAGGLQPPASAMAAGLYLVSLIFAYVVVVQLGLLIGLIAFWTVENLAFIWIYRFASVFFGGALVPLWLMPPALRSAAEFLPFQAYAFTPTSIYLGVLMGDELARALGLQLAWVAILFGITRLLWLRAMRRVMSFGG